MPYLLFVIVSPFLLCGSSGDTVSPFLLQRGCSVARWCWVDGVLLIWLKVGQGPTLLALGAVGGSWDLFVEDITQKEINSQTD